MVVVGSATNIYLVSEINESSGAGAFVALSRDDAAATEIAASNRNYYRQLAHGRLLPGFAKYIAIASGGVVTNVAVASARFNDFWGLVALAALVGTACRIEVFCGEYAGLAEPGAP